MTRLERSLSKNREQKQRAKTLEAAKLLREKLGVALRYREQSLSYQWEVILGTPHDFRRVGDVLAELEFLPLESLSLCRQRHW